MSSWNFTFSFSNKKVTTSFMWHHGSLDLANFYLFLKYFFKCLYINRTYFSFFYAFYITYISHTVYLKLKMKKIHLQQCWLLVSPSPGNTQLYLFKPLQISLQIWNCMKVILLTCIKKMGILHFHILYNFTEKKKPFCLWVSHVLELVVTWNKLGLCF